MAILGNHPLSVILTNFSTTWRPGWRQTRFAAIGTSDVGKSVFSSSWGSGWTSVVPCEVGSKRFIVLLKKSNGAARVLPVNTSGKPGTALSTPTLTAGFTSVTSYQAGGSTFLFFLNATTGAAEVRSLSAAGVLSSPVETYTWSAGWTSAASFVAGGKPYLFLLKDSTGLVHIQKLDSDGTVGARADTHNWSNGWTHARFCKLGGTDHLLIYKSGTGDAHLHAMTAKGEVGASVYSGNLGKGWTSVASWDVGQDARLALLAESTGKVEIRHIMESGSVISTPIGTHDWSSGWTNATITEVLGAHYLVLLKASSGTVHVHAMTTRGSGHFMLADPKTGKVQSRRVNNDGRISGSPDWSDTWSTGWDNLELIDVGGITYLFRLASKSGAVRVHTLSNVGAPLTETYANTWSSGWDTTCWYPIGDTTYLLLLKSATGKVHIHRVGDDGAPGQNIYNQTWETGWSIARPFSVDNQSFLMLLNPSTGAVNIRKLMSDGKPGSSVFTSTWSKGWDNAVFYPAAGKTILLLLKSGSGDVHIHHMKADGSVGPMIHESTWSKGWDSATIYRVKGKLCMSLLKSSTGAGHLHWVNPDGTLGARTNPAKPFTKAHVEDQLTHIGYDKGLLADYFNDISRGRLTVRESTVTEWVTSALSWEEVKEKSRGGKIQASIDAATAAGYSVPSTSSVVAIHANPGDSGASGRGVLAHPNRMSLEFFAHEVLHTWDIDHAYSDDLSIPPAWGNPLRKAEYDDPWDVMSAMGAYGFDNGLNKSVGPGMNLCTLGLAGWLEPDHVREVLAGGAPTTITIHTLSRRLNRTDIGVRVPIGPGEFTTVEYRTRQEWDRGIPRDEALIVDLAAAPLPGSTVWKGTWDSGLSLLHPFNVGTSSFVLALTTSSGSMIIHALEASGSMGPVLESATWSSGWDVVTSYEIGGKTFLFLLKSGSGTVHIQQMKGDGTVGAQVFSSTWSKGWTIAEPFSVDGKLFLYLMKTSDGTVHIHRVQENGIPGEQVDTKNWSSGWTDARFHRRGNATFMLLHKRASGTVHIHALEAAGKIGAEIQSTSWQPGNDSVTSYGIRDTFVVRHSSITGKGAWQPVDDDGKLKDVPKEAEVAWSKGWTHVRAFGTWAGLFLLIYKAGSGRVEIVRICRTRVRRTRRNIDANRGPVQAINDAALAVKIEVLSNDPSKGTAVVKIG